MSQGVVAITTQRPTPAGPPRIPRIFLLLLFGDRGPCLAEGHRSHVLPLSWQPSAWKSSSLSFKCLWNSSGMVSAACPGNRPVGLPAEGGVKDFIPGAAQELDVALAPQQHITKCPGGSVEDHSVSEQWTRPSLWPPPVPGLLPCSKGLSLCGAAAGIEALGC